MRQPGPVHEKSDTLDGAPPASTTLTIVVTDRSATPNTFARPATGRPLGAMVVVLMRQVARGKISEVRLRRTEQDERALLVFIVVLESG